MATVQQNTSEAIGSEEYPEWIAQTRSGVVLVDRELLARFGHAISEVIRRNAGTGSQPETLVLARDPDRLVGDGGPTAVSPHRIIDLLRRDELDLSDLRRVLAFVPAADIQQFATDVGFIVSKAGAEPQLVLLSHDDIAPDTYDRLPRRRWRHDDLRGRLYENKGRLTMAGSPKKSHIDNPEELKTRLKDLVRRIHDEEDPHELTEYKKFVKRHVSIFSRAYLTAYLVKLLVDDDTAGGIPKPRKAERPTRQDDKKERRKDKRKEKPSEKSDPQETGNVAPEDRQTLFVSVGKNRRVYPKDFVALFAELDAVQGDDIGQIKILDNYSFVEVDKSVADDIIEAYNGYDFRGRKLTVNYARNKKD